MIQRKKVAVFFLQKLKYATTYRYGCDTQSCKAIYPEVTSRRFFSGYRIVLDWLNLQLLKMNLLVYESFYFIPHGSSIHSLMVWFFC